MSRESTKLGNETSKYHSSFKKRSSPDTNNEFSNKSKDETTFGVRPEFEDVDEIISLFQHDTNGIRLSESTKQMPERQNNEEDESFSELDERIRSIRIQAVKPEITINMISDKLASLEHAAKEIEKKREDINQFATDVNKHIEQQFEDLKRKLEAKFAVLRENANQILQQRLDEFEEMQKNVLVRLESMQKLKNAFVEIFHCGTKIVHQNELNLSKLHEKKPDIHYFIQAMDPFDLRATINQIRVRNSLSTRGLEGLIENLYLVESEIAGLKGLEDVSFHLQEKKLNEQTAGEKNLSARGAFYQKSPSRQLNRTQFSKTQRESSEKRSDIHSPSKPSKGLASLLRVGSNKHESNESLTHHNDDSRMYLSPSARNESIEKKLFEAENLISPSSLVSRYYISCAPRHTKVSQTSKEITLSAVLEARKKVTDLSLNASFKSPNERQSSATTYMQSPSNKTEEKLVSLVKLNAITATVTKKSLLGSSLQCLRKQREAFLKSSFKNWN